MGVWASSAAALAELRRFVNDGPEDRPIKDKAVVGVVNGVNTIFLTYEDRLVPGSLAVTVDETPVVATLLDATLGRFQITGPPPVAGAQVRARYYWQLFTDTDLDDALRLAAGEIRESEDVTTIPVGLKGAALMFAKGFAFQKQAVRWAERLSERFLLQEQPLDGQPTNRANLFEDIARTALREARELRTSYYTGHSRRHVPAFAITKPAIRPIGPRR